ncbi:MAG TPA: hypothetical protein VFR94_02820 [Nitrososphaeraceae archaeon]|nr:hypothetical protein [Nitrososphaeraceae archaeon]
MGSKYSNIVVQNETFVTLIISSTPVPQRRQIITNFVPVYFEYLPYCLEKVNFDNRGQQLFRKDYLFKFANNGTSF